MVNNLPSSSSLVVSSDASQAVDASWEITTTPVEGLLLTAPPIDGVLLDAQQAKAFLPGKAVAGGASGVGEESNVLSPQDVSPGTPQSPVVQGSPVTKAPQSPVDFGDSLEVTGGDVTPPKSPRSASAHLRRIYQSWTGGKRSPSAER